MLFVVKDTILIQANFAPSASLKEDIQKHLDENYVGRNFSHGRIYSIKLLDHGIPNIDILNLESSISISVFVEITYYKLSVGDILVCSFVNISKKKNNNDITTQYNLKVLGNFANIRLNVSSKKTSQFGLSILNSLEKDDVVLIKLTVARSIYGYEHIVVMGRIHGLIQPIYLTKENISKKITPIVKELPPIFDSRRISKKVIELSSMKDDTIYAVSPLGIHETSNVANDEVYDFTNMDEYIDKTMKNWI